MVYSNDLGYDPDEWEECPPPDHFLAFGLFTRVWLAIVAIVLSVLFFWLVESNKKGDGQKESKEGEAKATKDLESRRKEEHVPLADLSKVVEEVQRSRTATPKRRRSSKKPLTPEEQIALLDWERQLKEVTERRLRESQEHDPEALNVLIGGREGVEGTQTTAGEVSPTFGLSPNAFEKQSLFSEPGAGGALLKEIEKLRMNECATPPSTPPGGVLDAEDDAIVRKQMASDLEQKLVAKFGPSIDKGSEEKAPVTQAELGSATEGNKEAAPELVEKVSKRKNTEVGQQERGAIEDQGEEEPQAKPIDVTERKKESSSSEEEGFVKVGGESEEEDRPTAIAPRPPKLGDARLQQSLHINVDAATMEPNELLFSPPSPFDEWSDSGGEGAGLRISVEIDDTVTANDIEFLRRSGSGSSPRSSGSSPLIVEMEEALEDELDKHTTSVTIPDFIPPTVETTIAEFKPSPSGFSPTEEIDFPDYNIETVRLEEERQRQLDAHEAEQVLKLLQEYDLSVDVSNERKQVADEEAQASRIEKKPDQHSPQDSPLGFDVLNDPSGTSNSPLATKVIIDQSWPEVDLRTTLNEKEAAKELDIQSQEEQTVEERIQRFIPGEATGFIPDMTGEEKEDSALVHLKLSPSSSQDEKSPYDEPGWHKQQSPEVKTPKATQKTEFLYQPEAVPGSVSVVIQQQRPVDVTVGIRAPSMSNEDERQLAQAEIFLQDAIDFMDSQQRAPAASIPAGGGFVIEEEMLESEKQILKPAEGKGEQNLLIKEAAVIVGEDKQTSSEPTTSRQIKTNEVFEKKEPIFDDADDAMTYAPEIQSVEIPPDQLSENSLNLVENFSEHHEDIQPVLKTAEEPVPISSDRQKEEETKVAVCDSRRLSRLIANQTQEPVSNQSRPLDQCEPVTPKLGQKDRVPLAVVEPPTVLHRSPSPRRAPKTVPDGAPQPPQFLRSFGGVFDDVSTASSSSMKQSSLLSAVGVTSTQEMLLKLTSLDALSAAMRKAGLESSNLIFGIDYTASNKYQGEHSFDGRSLHSVDNDPKVENPYQQVIKIMGRTLAPFDSAHGIPVFGFGDSSTGDWSVFALNSASDDEPEEDFCCRDLDHVLKVYNEMTPHVELSGPTNFAPLIYRAIEICQKIKDYHILVIIADGQVTNERATRKAIVAACQYPLSIIVVGVGDGPWDMMKVFDESLPKRPWDNFHFVEFHKILEEAEKAGESSSELAFAIHSLLEVPDQYQHIRRLGLIGSRRPSLNAPMRLETANK